MHHEEAQEEDPPHHVYGDGAGEQEDLQGVQDRVKEAPEAQEARRVEQAVVPGLVVALQAPAEVQAHELPPDRTGVAVVAQEALHELDPVGVYLPPDAAAQRKEAT